MSPEITPELEEIVRGIVRAGHYENEAAVLHEALELLQRRDQLRNDVREGISELDRGKRIDGEKVFRELEQRAAVLAESAK